MEIKKVIEHFLRIIMPMILAWISARSLWSYNKGDKNKTVAVQVAIEKLVMSIFLPLVFGMAILQINIQLTHLALIATGILIPLITYFTARFIYSEFSKDLSSPYWEPFMPATFGGGNRGTLLVVLLSPILFKDLDSKLVLSYFTTVDLGNFIILMFVIRKLMYKHSGAADSSPLTECPSDKITGSLKDITKFMPQIVTVFALIISALDGANAFSVIKQTKLFDNIRSSFFDYGSHISTLFIYLTFTSIFMMSFTSPTRIIDVGKWVRMLMVALSARFFGIIISGLFLYFVNGYYILWHGSIFKALIFSVGIFLILPPSSQFSNIVREIYGRQCSQIDDSDLARLVIHTNVLYILIIFACMALFLVKL